MKANARPEEPTLTYLQMEDPKELRAQSRGPEVTLELIEGKEVKRLTLAVGRDFRWPSQQWDENTWATYLEDPALRHRAGIASGSAIGILSVNVRSLPHVEIDSFGILPEVFGRGLGGAFLTESLRMIWSLPASRVWLHTSSDDHPNAMMNYLARGFQPFDGGPR